MRSVESRSRFWMHEGWRGWVYASPSTMAVSVAVRSEVDDRLDIAGPSPSRSTEVTATCPGAFPVLLFKACQVDFPAA
jgi:hypothetical protein